MRTPAPAAVLLALVSFTALACHSAKPSDPSVRDGIAARIVSTRRLDSDTVEIVYELVRQGPGRWILGSSEPVFVQLWSGTRTLPDREHQLIAIDGEFLTGTATTSRATIHATVSGHADAVAVSLGRSGLVTAQTRF